MRCLYSNVASYVPTLRSSEDWSICRTGWIINRAWSWPSASVELNSSIFWVITRSKVVRNRRFGTTYWSETSISNHLRPRNNPEVKAFINEVFGIQTVPQQNLYCMSWVWNPASAIRSRWQSMSFGLSAYIKNALPYVPLVARVDSWTLVVVLISDYLPLFNAVKSEKTPCLFRRLYCVATNFKK
jgi:hypothetical protein